MSFSIGIVGLPNVGKSTLFSALTKVQVDCANYPFCTIEPNKAVVAVPDERLLKLAELENSEKILSTTIEFVDIAGLVTGAHKGEGLGNKFLANIREVDAIIHLVRAFENEDIAHISGKIDPGNDEKTILLELILADLEYAQKIITVSEKAAKAVTQTGKENRARLEILKKIEAALFEEKLIADLRFKSEEKALIKDLRFLTAKPIITVYNVPGQAAKQESGPADLKIDVKLEYEVSQLPPAEQDEYRVHMLSERGSANINSLTDLIAGAYESLNLITFITSGPKETRAWTVRAGKKAPEAAGRIHSDFQRGFIKAEVISWDKLLEARGYARARELGWLRLEGKEYIVQEGDVMHFKFNL